jgi:hypothetical protein
MGAQANLNQEWMRIDSANDSIVIRNYGAGINGGRTLDMSDFPSDLKCIRAGHIVIRSTEDETLYKPMPVAAGGKAYASLPANYEYVGVVVATKPVDYPLVGIMYAGEVNDVASPYPVTSIKAALKTALPGLVFMHD